MEGKYEHLKQIQQSQQDNPIQIIDCKQPLKEEVIDWEKKYHNLKEKAGNEYLKLKTEYNLIKAKLEEFESKEKYYFYEEDMFYIKSILSLNKTNYTAELNKLNEKAEKTPNDLANIQNLEECIKQTDKIYNKYFK